MSVHHLRTDGARNCTADFSISGPFDTPNSPMRFGDYHTAGGFQRPPRLKIKRSGDSRLTRQSGGTPRSYDCFPVWKQSDGNIHFARTSYTEPDQSAVNGHNRLKDKAVAILEFQPLGFSKISVRRLEYDWPGRKAWCTNPLFDLRINAGPHHARKGSGIRFIKAAVA